MDTPRKFPNWEQLYQEQAVETMPWFDTELDVDLAQALSHLNLSTGTALDLGTGPGTQAIALAARGFKVTGTDISAAAISQAQSKAQEQGLDITFTEDDILNSHLTSGEFDFIFDRGCFHVLPPATRQDYIATIRKLIKPKGYLFLKCFSHLEAAEKGPYRFTPEEIKEIFSLHFNALDIKETVYQGTLNPLPKALFCIFVVK